MRGQKLAAFSPDDEQGGNDKKKCFVVIVKAFDTKTGLYTVRAGEKGTWQLPFDSLIHFNHNQKSFRVGDVVYSLFRAKGTGLSSEFYKGKVVTVSNSVINVDFENGDSAIARYNELFVAQ